MIFLPTPKVKIFGCLLTNVGLKNEPVKIWLEGLQCIFRVAIDQLHFEALEELHLRLVGATIVHICIRIWGENFSLRR